MNEGTNKGEGTDLDHLTFGAWLKKLREDRKITLEEIAAVTKIHITQLKHIEADEQEKLPAPAFIRGFLTAYARHLKIEEDDVLARFSLTRSDNAKDNPLILPVGSRAAQSTTFPKVRVVTSPTFGQAPGAKDLEKKKAPKITFKGTAWTTAGLLVVAGLVTVFILGKKYRDEKNKTAQSTALETTTLSNEIPTASANSSANSLAAVSSVSTTSPAPVAAAAAVATTNTAKPTDSFSVMTRKNTLEIRALEQSWVNIRLDDGESRGIALKSGKSYTYTADRRAFLSLSNAGGVEIRWNGQWFAAPGYRGDVKALSLPEQLSSLTPRAAPASVRSKSSATTATTPAATETSTSTPPPSTPGANTNVDRSN